MKKIVWAIDPFDSERDIYEIAACVLRILSHQIEIEIQPVYVLSLMDLNPADSVSLLKITHYRNATARLIENVIESLGLKKVLPSQVLFQVSSSTKEAADILSDHAAAIEADFILVSSRGRAGFRHLLMGSFAERLFLRSSVSTLVLGPEARPFHRISRIVFPTQLRNHPDLLFRNVVRTAKKLEAQLILFHSLPQPIEPLFQSGVSLLGGAWIPIHGYFRKDAVYQLRRTHGWARWAKSQGVEVDCIVQPQGGSIPEEIVSLAEERDACIIMMEEHSRALAAAWIGSVTWQVIKIAPCPVWILRPSIPALPKHEQEGGKKIA